MLNLKKENTNNNETSEATEEENVAIHTMQEDLDALSGIFPKNNQMNTPKEEKEVGLKENKAETKDGQYFNPFLEKQTEQERSRIADFADKSVDSDNNILNNQELEENMQPKSSLKKLFWIMAVIIIIGASAFGGYYFYNKKKLAREEAQLLETKKAEDLEAQKSEKDSEPVQVETLSKYSFDKPNYLSIDTENPSYENFKEIISKAFLDIKEAGNNKPVEFVITDNKNNPIAFSIFSAIIKLKLPNELLKNLNDNFSILAYYDSGNPRLAISIKVIDESKANALIKNEEVKLPVELASLFLDNVSLPKEKVVFQEGNYKGINIRYFNFTPDRLATVDYSFNGGDLIIATSKKSMWAVLDKVLSEGK